MIAGVGHVESAARGLAPVADALRERAAAGRPLLGICVGMQLLFEESEEGGRGLGLLEGRVRRVRARRVPHMGWNALALTRPVASCSTASTAPTSTSRTATRSSRRARSASPRSSTTGRSSPPSSPASLAGVQFHPERSGAAGARVLENALRWSRSA